MPFTLFLYSKPLSFITVVYRLRCTQKLEENQKFGTPNNWQVSEKTTVVGVLAGFLTDWNDAVICQSSYRLTGYFLLTLSLSLFSNPKSCFGIPKKLVQDLDAYTRILPFFVC